MLKRFLASFFICLGIVVSQTSLVLADDTVEVEDPYAASAEAKTSTSVDEEDPSLQDPNLTLIPSVDDYQRMVMVPAGGFKMGSTFEEIKEYLALCKKVDRKCALWWFDDELPKHDVYLYSFWIDIFEVTNKEYLEFVLATDRRPALDETCESERCWAGNIWKGKSFPEKAANQPVTQVSWEDAYDYCAWRGKRLPSEAEWEKAARGPNGGMYPWGDSSPKGRATYKRKWRGVLTMTNVGSYSRGMSPYGVHDMAGNVWEWVNDWYGRNYYKNSAKRNPTGPKEGYFRVSRGGSWVNFEDSLRSSLRRWSRADVRFNDTGFRCAKDHVRKGPS